LARLRRAAVADRHRLLVDQLQIGLVDEARGVERARTAFARELSVGQTPQLLVDQRQQLVEHGARVARGPGEERIDAVHPFGSREPAVYPPPNQGRTRDSLLRTRDSLLK